MLGARISPFDPTKMDQISDFSANLPLTPSGADLTRYDVVD
jgi:hypothetical protein